MKAQYQFVFSEDFLVAANVRYRRQHPWHRFSHGVNGVLAFMLLALGAFFALMVKLWLVIPFGAIAGSLFLGQPIDAWILRRRFRKSPYYNDAISLTLSDEGFLGVGRTSEARLQWPVFTKARRFSDGLLLFQGPQVFHWLPDSAAAFPGAIEETERLVRAHVKDFRTA